jgi:hypothetical protein
LLTEPSTIQSYFYFLLNSPDVYKKVLIEIDEAQSSGKLSEVISYVEAQELHYSGMRE